VGIEGSPNAAAQYGNCQPARFRSADAIASYVGVAPRLRQ
jgi:hypothetical protein